ncbi:MAG: AI-2E family transporter, partial [Cyanobacteria bacterium J06639_18]
TINMKLIVVLSFYMLLYGRGVWHGLINILPKKIRVPFANSLQLNFHYYFLSQILLALFMVVSLTPIFFLLGVPFALLFAIIIGISQLIPFVGATLGIGLVTLLILMQNFWLAIEVAAVAILIQQLKDNLLTPKLLGDFIGLNPVWILVSILIGFEIAGLFGTLIAIPIAGTIKDTFDTLNHNQS